jgi:hypothetical protein
MEIKNFRTLVLMIDDFISEQKSGEKAQNLIEYLIVDKIGYDCYDMILECIMKPYDEKDLIDLYLDAKRKDYFNRTELAHITFDACMEQLLDYVDDGLKKGNSVTTSLGTIKDINKKEFQIQLRFESDKNSYIDNNDFIESVTNIFINQENEPANK